MVPNIFKVPVPESVIFGLVSDLDLNYCYNFNVENVHNQLLKIMFSILPIQLVSYVNILKLSSVGGIEIMLHLY